MESNELFNAMIAEADFVERKITVVNSTKILKKADNLTAFNKKNQSEGNKHIRNNDL